MGNNAFGNLLQGVMDAGFNALVTMANLAIWQINTNTQLASLRVQADVFANEFATAIGIGETFSMAASKALGDITQVDKAYNTALIAMSA